MKNKFLLFLALFLSISLLTTGCGKTVSEKAAEKSLENSFGQDADVDIDDDTVTVETDAGTWQAGEDVSLPNNWPDDIYVADGQITSATANDNGFGLTIMSDQSVSNIKTKYQQELADAGWNINMTMDMGEGAILGADKEDRTLSISIGNDDDEQTTIVIVEGR